MPALSVMSAFAVFVFAFLAGVGWHIGGWVVGKLLK